MKYITDYVKTYNDLGLSEVYKEVHNRTARTKRSLNRMVKHLESSSNTRNTLKQYVKIITEQNKQVKTRTRALIIIPKMVDRIVRVYDGRKYVPVKIIAQNTGRYLGQLIPTRTCNPHSTKGTKPIKRT